MIGRLQRVQFVAFIVVTILAVLAVVWYSGIPRTAGVGRYPLYVHLASSGNLYQQAVVTLRGAPVGDVHDIALTESGVTLTILIDDKVLLPSRSDLYVRSVSAIGEQFLDFVPKAGGGPPFSPGDSVPDSDTHMPIPITDVLAGANELVKTLPRDDLNSALTELSAAFTGTSGDWRRVLDASAPLLASAQANLAPTQRLIGDLQPVLNTQVRVGSQTRAALSNLAQFTNALRASDAALRGAIEKTPSLTSSTDDLVRRVRDPLPDLILGLTDVGDVAETYIPNIRHIAIVLPAMIDYVQSAIYNSPVPGALRIYIRSQVDDPPPCTQGFAGATQRNPDDLSPVPPFVNIGCKVARDAPIAVRGTHNAPCPDDPSRGSMTASGCGLDFQSPSDTSESLNAAMATIMETARRNPLSRPKPSGAPPPDTEARVESTPPLGPLGKPNG
jgi:phospholipid/cholesterol/gamma-HCH transport system substrate-binding protein